MLISLLGGTYGNMTLEQRTTVAREARAAVSSAGGAFLVCVDLHKNNGLIQAAYDVHDAFRPLRMEFALNRLDHVNRTYGADFVRENYAPITWYDPYQRSVIAVLRSKCRQKVNLARLGMTIELEEGEAITRDVMHKFTLDELDSEFRDAGWTSGPRWVHERFGYAVAMFLSPGARQQPDRP